MNSSATALRNVVGLSLSAFSEMVTSSVNFSQGIALQDAITDAILEIDSEAEEVTTSTDLVSVEEPVTMLGTLPARYSEGKLQRIRALRARLLGDATSPGAIAETELLLQAGL